MVEVQAKYVSLADLIAASPADLGLTVLTAIIRMHEPAARQEQLNPYPRLRFLSAINLTSDIVNGFVDQPPARQAAAEAIAWLMSHDLIAEVHQQGSSSSSGTIVATRLGHEIAALRGVEATGSALRTIEIIPPAMRSKVLLSLSAGEFDGAIVAAYKYLEVRMRERANLTSGDFGSRLVRRFFARVEATTLQRTDRRGDLADEEHLFVGLFGLYRDRAVHEAPHIDSIDYALEVLIGAAHLLRLVEAAEITTA